MLICLPPERLRATGLRTAKARYLRERRFDDMGVAAWRAMIHDRTSHVSRADAGPAARSEARRATEPAGPEVRQLLRGTPRVPSALQDAGISRREHCLAPCRSGRDDDAARLDGGRDGLAENAPVRGEAKRQVYEMRVPIDGPANRGRYDSRCRQSAIIEHLSDEQLRANGCTGDDVAHSRAVPQPICVQWLRRDVRPLGDEARGGDDNPAPSAVQYGNAPAQRHRSTAAFIRRPAIRNADPLLRSARK